MKLHPPQQVAAQSVKPIVALSIEETNVAGWSTRDIENGHSNEQMGVMSQDIK